MLNALKAGQTAKRRLPIGIQTFRKIRENHYYYVDKTAYIDYAAKYRSRGEPIYLIGVEFSRETRNVSGFAVEP